MTLRYAGTCRVCGSALSAGATGIYDRSRRTVRCAPCPVDSDRLEAGTAGASARREYERRMRAREERIRADHPRLGGFLLAAFDARQSTKAWEGGAIGEERMASELRRLPDSFRTLHDRRLSGSRANIDHIVIGPGGIWVIDAKRYRGRRPSLRIDGGLFRPRTETLRIGGRDGTKLVEGVRSQVGRVGVALDEPRPPVVGVLCFIDADWPLFGGSFAIDDIQVVWPRRLVKRMISTPPVPLDVDLVTADLAAAFPPA
jgi:hypothetical protein